MFFAYKKMAVSETDKNYLKIDAPAERVRSVEIAELSLAAVIRGVESSRSEEYV